MEKTNEKIYSLEFLQTMPNGKAKWMHQKALSFNDAMHSLSNFAELYDVLRMHYFVILEDEKPYLVYDPSTDEVAYKHNGKFKYQLKNN